MPACKCVLTFKEKVMFKAEDILILKSTGEMGICVREQGDSVHGYFQSQGFTTVLKRQVEKQSLFIVRQKLDQYRKELKNARSEDKHKDLIEYLAAKVKEQYLLYVKLKDEK